MLTFIVLVFGINGVFCIKPLELSTNYRPLPDMDIDLQNVRRTPYVVYQLCSPNHCDTVYNGELNSKPKLVAIVISDVEELFGNQKVAERIGIGFAKMGYTTVLVLWKRFHVDYFTAVINAHGVGRQIANYLVQNMRNIHLIGLGVGAHIAGYVGKICKNGGLIHRITGLDPTRLLYEYLYGDERYRLDRYDAEFVDVYHTDYKGKMRVGCIISIGDVDFYQKGGDRCQDVTPLPEDAMVTWKEPLKTLRLKISTCKHNLAAINFLEAMSVNCSIYGVRNPKDPCQGNNCLPVGIMAKQFMSEFPRTDGNYVYNCSQCTWGVPKTTDAGFLNNYKEFQSTNQKLLDERGWLEWIIDSAEYGFSIIWDWMEGKHAGD